MMKQMRKYPIGIQTFSEIIRGGYVYIDKTDLVWDLAHYGKYIFLSRPRRFGKSLLSTTLGSYFNGERELFEGLKIMDLEHEWKQYPVLHLDLSMAKNQENAEELRTTLMFLLNDLREVYGENPQEQTPGKCLKGLITRASQQSQYGQVAVIIDEYDAPLLDVLHEDERLKDMRKVMQEFFQPLKAMEAKVRFCFITGITKFSQLSIFSTINNLMNVTMDAKFGAICGITEQELVSTLKEDIGPGMTPQELCSALPVHRGVQLNPSYVAGAYSNVFNSYNYHSCCGDRKSTRLNSSHTDSSRMPSSA